MVEPVKPFACTMPECGMTFTNEDHLHVHTKKHDMVLQLGMEQKAAFVADQTPTPTRFIRNCEEVGLFQDLQNVNPFDEGFKRAMETKHNILSLENTITTSASDELHTPQMVFPLLDPGDSTLYSTTNNQRNITISRSSSDENGAIKEFETTTISKLTNEVTTISRIVEKHEEQTRTEDRTKDGVIKDSVSYTNNVIKIHSERRKDDRNPSQTLIYEDTVIKNNNLVKDIFLSDPGKLQIPDIPPMMSQKSIDFVVDSLTNDLCKEDQRKVEDDSDNYEVLIKLPNGKQVRMRSVDEAEKVNNAREKLKKKLTEKTKTVPKIQPPVTVVPLSTGTLIPVTLVSPPTMMVHKVPIPQFKVNQKPRNPAKRNMKDDDNKQPAENNHAPKASGISGNSDKRASDLEYRSAAARRYRARLKESWTKQATENRQLKEANEKLILETAILKVLITEHMKKCPNADDLRKLQEKLKEKNNHS